MKGRSGRWGLIGIREEYVEVIERKMGDEGNCSDKEEEKEKERSWRKM